MTRQLTDQRHSVTFPHDPYPAGTNLFPPHAQVRAQLMRFVEKHNLRQFVRFGHEVLDARFEDESRWTLDVVAAGERSSLQYECVAAFLATWFDLH